MRDEWHISTDKIHHDHLFAVLKYSVHIYHLYDPLCLLLIEIKTC